MRYEYHVYPARIASGTGKDVSLKGQHSLMMHSELLCYYNVY